MPRSNDEINGCTLLGNTGVKYPTEYNPDILETFKNKHPENDYLVTFNCPELLHCVPKQASPILRE